jgi:serine/threonine protein kinase
MSERPAKAYPRSGDGPRLIAMPPDAACITCRTPLPDGALFCSRCGTPTGAAAAAAPTQITPSASMPEPTQAKLARALGSKYDVKGLLGQGGFAEVFEVRDTDLARRLAVKVLRPDIAWSAGMLERFRQEARALAALNHPNILPIHFVGEGEGLVYYAMPFVEGQSVAGLLKSRGPMDVDRSLAIIRPVLEALGHAHAAGLIHRDIKPDNVMLEASSGRVLLVDFGIAKQVGGGGANLTQTGFVVGTPHYMSPEQALGQGNVDARSDIYAAGAMLFQMLTGTPPFEGESSQEIVGKHLSEPAPVAAFRNAKVPRWLSDVIVRCLAKKAADRYQSAAQVLEALAQGQKTGPTQTISAEKIAQQVKAGEPGAKAPPRLSVPAPRGSMPAEPPAPRPSRSPAGPPGSNAEPAPPRKRRPVGAVLGLVAVLMGAGVVFRMTTAPVLTVENRLIEPIRLTWTGGGAELAPGATGRYPLPRGKAIVAQWYLVRPTGDRGQQMGSDMQGTIALEHPRGRNHRVIDMWSAGAAYFAPLISNVTDQPLGVRVNVGLAGTLDCGCRVPPGAPRVHIGYYPLFGNSNVEVTAPDGRHAAFQNLGPQVSDKIGGEVGLRFTTQDLR